ncbi:hypothetical protein [Bradyrhizobium sp. SZCCHNS3051]|uniref:hypothetical protein n=1 Tax=Bradyrhizobium sp. SZCCHNS3051 TaxID=3057320 RepID=UPI002915FFB6|nr:hypothetical protein [Bradyrhizobium sp. SZCCHNS3051]
MSSKPDREQIVFECLAAKGEDAAGIFGVLQEVAPEIPVSLDGSERQEIIKAIIAECCASGDSLVAVDADGTIGGFVLAKPDRIQRFLKNDKTLSLRYVGVKKSWRQHGVFGGLMKNMIAKSIPLTASVLHDNQSAMADRLTKTGFVKVDSDEKETQLRRDV